MRPPPRGWAPKSFGGGRPPPRGCRHTALKIIASFLVGDSLGRERCRSLSAPSVARPKSGIWHCYAEPRLFVRCGLRPPPCFYPPYSPLQGFGGGRPPPRGCRHTALKIIACLFVGDSLGRERCRSLSAATQGSTTLRRVEGADFATLRLTPPPSFAPQLPSSAAHRSL